MEVKSGILNTDPSTLEIEDLANGVYILKVQGNKSEAILKFIKK